ncbi:MAG: hypothetical protein RML14_11725 [Meiothermus sp.]|uniref:hypothetical protein n=1 Tax=Meiothermus sp. TaxID=1955249 RepID=UPI00298EDA96|nr:hypothetical protein [Meiothermus sp.]MDW8482506.1 hypothetical protein [Meiothermus sp.]
MSKNAIIHFSYVDFDHFIEKLNRYTTIEAQQAYARRERPSMVAAFSRALFEFANVLFRKKGYLDGWRGFYLSGLMAAYRWATYAKLTQLYNVGRKGKNLRALQS